MSAPAAAATTAIGWCCCRCCSCHCCYHCCCSWSINYLLTYIGRCCSYSAGDTSAAAAVGCCCCWPGKPALWLLRMWFPCKETISCWTQLISWPPFFPIKTRAIINHSFFACLLGASLAHAHAHAVFDKGVRSEARRAGRQSGGAVRQQTCKGGSTNANGVQFI